MFRTSKRNTASGLSLLKRVIFKKIAHSAALSLVTTIIPLWEKPRQVKWIKLRLCNLIHFALFRKAPGRAPIAPCDDHKETWLLHNLSSTYLEFYKIAHNKHCVL